MSVHVHSYIHFNGDAQQALDFYHEVFGGEVFSDTFDKFASDEMPVDEADMKKIMHAFLKGDNGIELMLSDTPKGMEFNDGRRVTLTLSGDDEKQLREYWDKLTEGGTVTVPLAPAPWGGTFGMFVDKFGVEWMLNIGPVQG